MGVENLDWQPVRTIRSAILATAGLLVWRPRNPYRTDRQTDD